MRSFVFGVGVWLSPECRRGPEGTLLKDGRTQYVPAIHCNPLLPPHLPCIKWRLKFEDAADGATSIKLDYLGTVYLETYPDYSILSHNWSLLSDELSFQDIENDPTATRTKTEQCKMEQCIKAIKRRLRHTWIDTNCISRAAQTYLRTSSLRALGNAMC